MSFSLKFQNFAICECRNQSSLRHGRRRMLNFRHLLHPAAQGYVQVKLLRPTRRSAQCTGQVLEGCSHSACDCTAHETSPGHEHCMSFKCPPTMASCWSTTTTSPELHRNAIRVLRAVHNFRAGAPNNTVIALPSRGASTIGCCQICSFGGHAQAGGIPLPIGEHT